MIITAIEPYYKGKNRMAIYLNDEFSFVLYKGELSKYGLKAGMNLSDDLYQSIIDEVLIKRARLRAMNLLMKQDRTEADIRSKLSEGGYPEEVIEDAVNYLKSFHYLDDSRYAEDYTRFKSEYKSRADIARTLKAKGIDDSIIDSALSNIPDSSEVELVCKLINKKCRDISTLEYEDKMKLFAYLYRKGFTREIIEKAYREVETSSVEGDI